MAFWLRRLACRLLKAHSYACHGRLDHVNADGTVRSRWGS